MGTGQLHEPSDAVTGGGLRHSKGPKRTSPSRLRVVSILSEDTDSHVVLHGPCQNHWNGPMDLHFPSSKGKFSQSEETNSPRKER